MVANTIATQLEDNKINKPEPVTIQTLNELIKNNPNETKKTAIKFIEIVYYK